MTTNGDIFKSLSYKNRQRKFHFPTIKQPLEEWVVTNISAIWSRLQKANKFICGFCSGSWFRPVWTVTSSGRGGVGAKCLSSSRCVAADEFASRSSPHSALFFLNLSLASICCSTVVAGEGKLRLGFADLALEVVGTSFDNQYRYSATPVCWER